MIRCFGFIFVLAMFFYFILTIAAYVDKVSKDPDSYGDTMKTECRKVE